MSLPDGRGRAHDHLERGAERLFGYEEGEILGEDGTVLFVPEDRESGAQERELGKARTEGRAEDERWHLRKDGTRFWASGFVRPILDEDRDPIGFSKVARDLTERKRAEEAVDEVRRAERDRLARDLHDLVLQDLVYALQAWEARRLAPREAEEDVFDPRQTAESVGQGAMRERTALLNGRLEVLSEPAGGTTVRLRVPRPS